jgi:hypothetical protein
LLNNNVENLNHQMPRQQVTESILFLLFCLLMVIAVVACTFEVEAVLDVDEDERVRTATLRTFCPSPKRCLCQTDKIICQNFTSFSELEFSFERFIVDIIDLKPSQPLLLDDTLKLNGLKVRKQVILHNIKGFVIVDNPFAKIDLEPELDATRNYAPLELALFDSVFEFYESTNSLLLAPKCTRNDLLTSSLFENTVLRKFAKLSFNGNIVYGKNVCPFVFKHAKIDLILAYFMNSTNRLHFLSVPNVADIDATVSSLYIFNSQLSELDESLLSKLVFNNIKTLQIEGYLGNVQTNLLNWFKQLKAIHLELINLGTLLRNRSALWMNDLNKFENISATTSIKFMHKLIVMLHLTDKSQQFTYEEADFCLFQHFPSYKFVYPVIKTRPELNCTCTLTWLMKNYRSYLSQQVTSVLRTVSASNCFPTIENNDLFKVKTDECKFDARLFACNPMLFPTTQSTTTRTTPSTFTTAKPSTSLHITPPSLPLGSVSSPPWLSTSSGLVVFSTTYRDGIGVVQSQTVRNDFATANDYDGEITGENNNVLKHRKQAVRLLSVFIATVGFVSISAILGFVLYLYR